MPGFQNALREEMPDQGYSCLLPLAESNLCQSPELLLKGDELGTFSVGRVLPNQRISDVFEENLPKQADACFTQYTLF